MIPQTAWLVVELAVLFLAVTLAVQLAQRRAGQARLQGWLGGSAPVAALKGVAIGFATPFCTFSAIPMLIGFRQAGVRAAGYVAFIVAAPVLDPVLFGAIALLAGPGIALLYAAVTLVAATSLALVADVVGIERHLKPLPAGLAPAPATATVRAGAVGTAAARPPAHGGPADATCGVGDPGPPWRGWTAESRAAARSALALLRSLAPLLVVGIGLGVLIQLVLTPETTARLTGEAEVFAIPVAAILGTPLYLSTVVLVPIADALLAAGVGPGAVVALTISGVGASVPEFLLLTRLASLRIVSLLFAYVLVVAVVGGLLTRALVG